MNFVATDVGVIVGRFQVDKLHEGHQDLIDFVCSQHKKVIIVLGIPAFNGTRENPLDFEIRSKMILESYPNIIILPLCDCRDNAQWSARLDTIVGACITPSQSATLYGSRDSFLKSYYGKYPTKELIGKDHLWSGTDIRDSIKRSVKNTEDFRTGAIWQSYNYYPRVISTVDIAIFNSNYSSLLLCRKSNEMKYRFVGGFADPLSSSYEEDAKREVWEEISLQTGPMSYLGSYNIQDWRYTGVDKIRTSFFMTTSDNLLDANARDDIADLTIWKFSEINSDLLVPEHHILLEKLKSVQFNIFGGEL